MSVVFLTVIFVNKNFSVLINVYQHQFLSFISYIPVNFSQTRWKMYRNSCVIISAYIVQMFSMWNKNKMNLFLFLQLNGILGICHGSSDQMWLDTFISTYFWVLMLCWCPKNDSLYIWFCWCFHPTRIKVRISISCLTYLPSFFQYTFLLEWSSSAWTRQCSIYYQICMLYLIDWMFT